MENLNFFECSVSNQNQGWLHPDKNIFPNPFFGNGGLLPRTIRFAVEDLLDDIKVHAFEWNPINYFMPTNPEGGFYSLYGELEDTLTNLTHTKR